MPGYPSLVVSDDTVSPLVHVPPKCLGLLVHPGSTITPTALDPGWHYHWPFLSAIRVYQFDSVAYDIAPGTKNAAFGDEPIVAVTQDHQLFTIAGTLTLQLQPNPPLERLQHLGKSSLQRLIRPGIRQSLRQVMAGYQASDLRQNADISSAINQTLNRSLGQHYISAQVDGQLNIRPYRNALTSTIGYK